VTYTIEAEENGTMYADRHTPSSPSPLGHFANSSHHGGNTMGDIGEMAATAIISEEMATCHKVMGEMG